MAKKNENIITLLKEKGYPVDIYNSTPQEISRYVRWAKRNLPELHYNHVAPSIYLVDIDDFERVFANFVIFRQSQTSEKATLMKELNDRLKEEKAQGLRDKRGQVIMQEAVPKQGVPAPKVKKRRNPVPVGKVKQAKKASKKDIEAESG